MSKRGEKTTSNGLPSPFVTAFVYHMEAIRTGNLAVLDAGMIADWLETRPWMENVKLDRDSLHFENWRQKYVADMMAHLKKVC